MRIIDTSNGPAIEDDGYVILPGDTQGLLHAATLDPAIVNELLANIAGYISTGTQAVVEKARLNDDGQVDITQDQVSGVVADVTRMQQAAQVLASAANALVTQLFTRPPEPEAPTTDDPQVAIMFPPGYPIAYLKVDPGGIAAVSYVTDLELIPEDIRRSAVDGTYEFYRQGPESTPVFMTPDEVVASLPAA